MLPSYTCGAVWHTCRCTEDDQRRRETELRERQADYQAEQLAEERELREAIEAVQAAERRLQEEREAEERAEQRRIEEEDREFARLESERFNQITVYFEYLRRVLGRLRLQQSLAIRKRHELGWSQIDEMRNELDSDEAVAQREAILGPERDKIVASTETTVKGLQRQHAAVLMETMTRHRKEQDDFMVHSLENEDPDAEIMQAEKLQELITAQDSERSTLKSRQAKEIQKWKSNGEASLRTLDSRMEKLVFEMRLEDAEKIEVREREMRNVVFADNKWDELLFATRQVMLAEDKRQMIQSGREAPEAPKKEAVVKPRIDTSPGQAPAKRPKRQALLSPSQPRRQAPTIPARNSERDVPPIEGEEETLPMWMEIAGHSPRGDAAPTIPSPQSMNTTQMPSPTKQSTSPQTSQPPRPTTIPPTPTQQSHSQRRLSRESNSTKKKFIWEIDTERESSQTT